jgi:hypothetical protein
MLSSDEYGVHVMEAYVLEKLFDQKNYVLVPPQPWRPRRTSLEARSGVLVAKKWQEICTG